MLIADRSTVANRLWNYPEENDFLIINLADSSQEIYSLSEDGANGLLIIGQYAQTCAIIDAPSPKAAQALLTEAGYDDSWRYITRNPEIKEWLQRQFGIEESYGYLHYAVDQRSFKPSESDCSNSVFRVDNNDPIREFAERENDRAIQFWSQGEPGDDTNGFAYCAKRDDQIIGYVHAGVQLDRLWEVSYVYVTPAERRQGYAKSLLSTITAKMLDRNLIPLYTVNAKNESSARTCESVGYRLCNTYWALEKRS